MCVCVWMCINVHCWWGLIQLCLYVEVVGFLSFNALHRPEMANGIFLSMWIIVPIPLQRSRRVTTMVRDRERERVIGRVYAKSRNWLFSKISFGTVSFSFLFFLFLSCKHRHAYRMHSICALVSRPFYLIHFACYYIIYSYALFLFESIGIFVSSFSAFNILESFFSAFLSCFAESAIFVWILHQNKETNDITCVKQTFPHIETNRIIGLLIYNACWANNFLLSIC